MASSPQLPDGTILKHKRGEYPDLMVVGNLGNLVAVKRLDQPQYIMSEVEAAPVNWYERDKLMNIYEVK